MTALPALVLLLLLLLLRIPDSSRWLVARGRLSAAADVLAWIGVSRAGADAEIAAAREASGTGGERLSWSRHRRPILLAISISIAGFNQLAGIKAVRYYLNDIFARAGSVSPDRQAVLIGITNLVFTMLGMALIDRVGRRTLLMAVQLAVV